MASKKFPNLCVQKGKGRPDRFYCDFPAEISETGKRQRVVFGNVTDPESRRRYLIAKERFESGLSFPLKPESVTPERITIANLVDRFMIWAKSHYQKHGQPTGTAHNYWVALRPFLVRYGTLPTDQFGLDQLEDYQSELDQSGRLCRDQVNKRISMIISVFLWGCRHKADGVRLVPVSVVSDLRAIERLKRGYAHSIDHPRRRSVPLADVEATLPLLPSPVADMVRVQLLTGARPEEVRLMRVCDFTVIDDSLWEYRPSKYKTEHHDSDGERKVIPIGPKAIEILKRRIGKESRKSERYLFRPEDGYLDRQSLRLVKDAKKTPSRQARDAERKRNPLRKFSEYYSRDSYNNAIKRAAKKACVAHWTPCQLRKSRATEIDRIYGAEVAASVLGHRNVKTTLEHYIDPNLAEAVRIARELG